MEKHKTHICESLKEPIMLAMIYQQHLWMLPMSTHNNCVHHFVKTNKNTHNGWTCNGSLWGKAFVCVLHNYIHPAEATDNSYEK